MSSSWSGVRGLVDFWSFLSLSILVIQPCPISLYPISRDKRWNNPPTLSNYKPNLHLLWQCPPAFWYGERGVEGLSFCSSTGLLLHFLHMLISFHWDLQGIHSHSLFIQKSYFEIHFSQFLIFWSPGCSPPSSPSSWSAPSMFSSSSIQRSDGHFLHWSERLACAVTELSVHY